MDYQKVIIAFLCILPTAWELYNDRNGENKKGKIKDTAVLLVVTGLIAGLSYWLGQRPVSAILLIFGIRVMFFDYLINIILYKRKVIEKPGAEKWFSYIGESTHWWDQLAAKVHPVIRIAVRALVFLVAVWWYLAT